MLSYLHHVILNFNHFPKRELHIKNLQTKFWGFIIKSGFVLLIFLKIKYAKTSEPFYPLVCVCTLSFFVSRRDGEEGMPISTLLFVNSTSIWQYHPVNRTYNHGSNTLLLEITGEEKICTEKQQNLRPQILWVYIDIYLLAIHPYPKGHTLYWNISHHLYVVS